MNKRETNAVAKMKAWCEANYENGADTMVECWSDKNYLELYREHGGSLYRAMRTLRNVAEIYADRQADARNSAF